MNRIHREVRNDRIVRFFRDGESALSIASQFGLKRRQIYRILRSCGVEIPKKLSLRDELKLLRRENEDLRQVNLALQRALARTNYSAV